MNHKDQILLRSIIFMEQFNNIMALINKSKDPKDYPMVAQWSDACFNELSDWEIILAAIDKELKTEGVECIYDSKTAMPLISYCNTDDQFAITVMYDHNKNNFFVNNLVDILAAIHDDRLTEYLES